MKQIRKRFASTVGQCMLLAVVTTASVGLNTDLSSPPRFDGAGYAVLAEALAAGRGYREIHEPGSPWHDHFPPGYPAALALLWQFTGRSVVAAHAFSAFCTVAAVVLAWGWFRTFYPPRLALALGVALALNWTWGRIGGSIQSEPFYIFWELLAVFVTVMAKRHGGARIGIVLGVVLAASMLVRHVGICLATAVAIKLGLHRRWNVLLPAALTTAMLVMPWVGWMAMVHHRTQVGLLTTEGLAGRIAGQTLFYLQRLPDQVTGPFVEVGTAFQRPAVINIVANLWAAMVTGIMSWGWVQTLRKPRRQLGSIITFTTLSLLLVWPFTEAGRFLIPLVPFLLVGLTEGLAHVLAWAGLRRPRNLAVAIVLTVSVPYAAYSIVNDRAGAQRRIHADFDAACQWIAHQAARRGPVLTRHPGEVFWQTGHPAADPDSADPDAIDRLIDRLGVTYLLIDEDRYLSAASSPLEQYVKRYPDRVAFVWGGSHGMTSIRVFETRWAR